MVRRVFVDTAYFIALANERDRLHRQALALEEHPPGRLLTTEWVLTEAADYLAAPSLRERFPRLMTRMQGWSDLRIIPADTTYFERGCALYAKRKDKKWSLTDCISFVIMHDWHIEAALTSDADFEQAGFQRLLDPSPKGVAEPDAPTYFPIVPVPMVKNAEDPMR